MTCFHLSSKCYYTLELGLWLQVSPKLFEDHNYSTMDQICEAFWFSLSHDKFHDSWSALNWIHDTPLTFTQWWEGGVPWRWLQSGGADVVSRLVSHTMSLITCVRYYLWSLSRPGVPGLPDHSFIYPWVSLLNSSAANNFHFFFWCAFKKAAPLNLLFSMFVKRCEPMTCVFWWPR